MNNTRAMELLEVIVNNLSQNGDSKSVVDYLLSIGFSKNELIRDFGFYMRDVLL